MSCFAFREALSVLEQMSIVNSQLNVVYVNCSVAAQMCYKLMFANISVATLVAHGALFLRCVVVFSNVCKQ